MRCYCIYEIRTRGYILEGKNHPPLKNNSRKLYTERPNKMLSTLLEKTTEELSQKVDRTDKAGKWERHESRKRPERSNAQVTVQMTELPKHTGEERLREEETKVGSYQRKQPRTLPRTNHPELPDLKEL